MSAAARLGVRAGTGPGAQASPGETGTDAKLASGGGFHHFGDVVSSYVKGRPTVAGEVADYLFEATAASPTVVEAGSGTGQLTQALVGRSGRLICLEPEERLREALVRHFPDEGVEVHPQTLEDCTVASSSVDLVVASGAWHWVDPTVGPRAAARLLGGDGVLAVVWNYTDLVGQRRNLIHGYAFIGRFAKFRTTCARVQVVADRSRVQLVRSGLFALAGTRVTTHAGSVDHATYESLIRSYGCAKHHTPDEVDGLAAAVRRILAAEGVDDIPLTTTTRVDLFRRTGPDPVVDTLTDAATRQS